MPEIAILFPFGAPPRAPCIRQTRQPRTAGAPQRFPVRFDLAVHRGASWALCMGLMVFDFAQVAPELLAKQPLDVELVVTREQGSS